MKMELAHYNMMKEEIKKLPRDKMLKVRAMGAGKDTVKFFVWVLFRAAKLHSMASDYLYPYLNDNHIETALRRIAKELDYI